MAVSIEDERLQVRLTFPREGVNRLVIEYPYEPEYRDRVLTALADLIRPQVKRKRLPSAKSKGGANASA